MTILIFDITADVYKVETVGDCYVAACGLPEPRKRHAVVSTARDTPHHGLTELLQQVMARFAHSCLRAVRSVTRRLEVELGPETSMLDFRFGLHSGPITGGVLRGKRARFQLFGETVNWGARIESTGIKGRIQMSTTTANLLRKAGKGHWVVPREDRVLAKGIGLIQTSWLVITPAKICQSGTEREASSNSDDVSASMVSEHEIVKDKLVGLVNWHAETLFRFLKVVAADKHPTGTETLCHDDDETLSAAEERILNQQSSPIVEISDHLEFPLFAKHLGDVQEAAGSVQLDPCVISQLQSFVWEISRR